MIITAKKISKKFGDSIVLKSIDLSINKGEIISVEGASGSGKTTLLNVLGLLDEVSSGDIQYYNGLEYDNFNSTDRVSTIGYIFQFHHLLSEFTIIDNLIIPQLIVGKSRLEASNYAEKMLRLLNLNHLSSRYPSEISGGECQRIALLRGVINKPTIVFADEPTGNLDRENSLAVIKLLNDLKKEFNISFVIATHDTHVTKIGDRSFYINNGRLNQ